MSGNDTFTCVTKFFGSSVSLDRFRCFMVSLSMALAAINLGYICIVLLGLIMLISVFGGIKENYRWFILNQAFWDLTISYSFICNNWVHTYLFGRSNSNCFYDFASSSTMSAVSSIRLWLNYCINYNSYSALLLFSFTRFLGLYFPQFYKKLTKHRRVFYTILIYNFISLFTNINSTFLNLWYSRRNYLRAECALQANLTNTPATSCSSGTFADDSQVKLFTILYNIFSSIMFLKPMLCLLLSFIAAVFIVIRISKQFQFQLKHHRTDFTNSLRICIVIVLQNVINLSTFIIESAKNIPFFVANTFNIKVWTTQSAASAPTVSNYIDFRLPLWLDGDYGLTALPILQAVVQLRIFIECLVVLFVMTGYRESVINFLKNSRNIFKNARSDITVTKVSSFNS